MNCTIPSSGGSAVAEAVATEALPPLPVAGVPIDVTPPPPVAVATEATPSPPTPEVPTPPSVSGGPSSSFGRGCSPATGLQVSHKSEQGGKEEKTLLMVSFYKVVIGPAGSSPCKGLRSPLGFGFGDKADH